MSLVPFVKDYLKAFIITDRAGTSDSGQRDDDVSVDGEVNSVQHLCILLVLSTRNLRRQTHNLATTSPSPIIDSEHCSSG